MYVPGDKYSVFYSTGGGTIPYGSAVDSWAEAKAMRNEVFFSRPDARAAWIMKNNPSQNTMPGLYGSTLRRTKHEARACTVS